MNTQSVIEHLKSCEKCLELFGRYVVPEAVRHVMSAPAKTEIESITEKRRKELQDLSLS